MIADLSLVEKAAEWPSLQGLVRIEAERCHKATGRIERETRFYITSLKPEAERLNRAIRQHWSIENKLHWALDVSFGEDLDRKRAANAAQNDCHAPTLDSVILMGYNVWRLPKHRFISVK